MVTEMESRNKYIKEKKYLRHLINELCSTLKELTLKYDVSEKEKDFYRGLSLELKEFRKKLNNNICRNNLSRVQILNKRLSNRIYMSHNEIDKIKRKNNLGKR